MDKIKIVIVLNLILVLSVITAQEDPGWTVRNTGSTHSIAINTFANPNIAGIPLENGDYIGVFYTRNDSLICGGFAKWENVNISLTAWGDDNLTPLKDGFDGSEDLNWRIWQNSTKKVYTGEVEFLTGPQKFASNGISVLSAISNIKPGWVVEENGYQHKLTVLTDVVFELESNTVSPGDYIGVFYDSSGTEVCGGFQFWNGDFDAIITAYGDDPGTIQKEGFTVQENFNWKIWLAESDIVLDAEATYESGPSVFTLSGESVVNLLSYLEPKGPGWTYRASDVNHTIAIPVNAEPNINGELLRFGDYIGVFYIENGKQHCAGYEIWDGTKAIAVTAWGDDAQTELKDGFSTGEVFNWKIWSRKYNQVFNAKATYGDTQPNDSLFQSNGLSVLSSLYYDENVEPPIIDTSKSAFLTAFIRFNEITETSSYRLIGLPGAEDIPLKNHVSGEWIAFWDDGSDIYVPYTEENEQIFNFGFGRAFWVLSDNMFVVDSLKVKRAKPQNKNFNIDLHKGWNIITSPYIRSADWNSVREVNEITDNIFLYTRGSFKKGSISLDPYVGYYFYNRKNLDSLSIPYSTSENNLSKNNSSQNDSLQNRLTVKMFREDEERSEITISLDENANYKLDDFDQFAPPSGFETDKIYIFNQNLETDYRYLSTDVRPLNEDGEVFTLFVKSVPGDSVEFKFDELADEELEYYFLNMNKFKNTNLKESSSVKVLQKHNIDEYKLVVGTKEFIEENPIPELPQDSKVYANYPNPFNPGTNIKFYLRSTSRVKVLVHNILGETINTLADDIIESGIHELRWDAGRLSSGIYFYTVIAVSVNDNRVFRETKKMLLVK
ncbi:MAG: T9SS type A sorting domain-containing protein [Melioribacteraceae bacterium]|nr:T9SS type A sorting domain-containing protein [Melioribacteraceae bacterium]